MNKTSFDGEIHESRPVTCNIEFLTSIGDHWFSIQILQQSSLNDIDKNV